MSSQADLPAGLAEVLERLRRFADDEDDPDGSALYARLCRGLADDPATASIMLAAPAEQRKPMLLLGAVLGYAHAQGRWLEWRGADALDGAVHGSR